MKINRCKFKSAIQGLVVGITASAMLSSIGYAQDDGDGIVETDDPQTLNDITVDGLFTGVSLLDFDVFDRSDEWGGVEFLGFIAPVDNTGTLFRTPPGDPNVLTFASIAPGTSTLPDAEDLYLMYAFRDRTDTSIDEGETVADIRFPVERSGEVGTETINIEVQIRGSNDVDGHLIGIDTDGDGEFDPVSSGVDSFFDVFVFADLDANPDFETMLDPDEFGIEAAVGFGFSPLGTDDPHMLVELEVALSDPGDGEDGLFFDDGIGPGTPDGSGYSPSPAFWGASFNPPFSVGIITIDPTGTTTFNASFVSPGAGEIPEPSSILLLICGFSGLAVYSRRRMRKSS